jgi:hypothetical protein
MEQQKQTPTSTANNHYEWTPQKPNYHPIWESELTFENNEDPMKHDGIHFLMLQHRYIKNLFQDRFLDQRMLILQKEIMMHLIREFTVHTILEECLVYPLIQQVVPNGEEIVNQHLQDHQKMKHECEEIQQMNHMDQNLYTKSSLLVSDMMDHFDQEDKELYVQLRQYMNEDQLDLLFQVCNNARMVSPKDIQLTTGLHLGDKPSWFNETIIRMYNELIASFR